MDPVSCTERVPDVAPDWEWSCNITGAHFELCRVLQDMGNIAPKSGKSEQMPSLEECVHGDSKEKHTKTEK